MAIQSRKVSSASTKVPTVGAAARQTGGAAASQEAEQQGGGRAGERTGRGPDGWYIIKKLGGKGVIRIGSVNPVLHFAFWGPL